MNYFDKRITFKTKENGEIIYYPNRFFGKGFIVPSLEKKQEIQKSVKHFYKIYFFLVIVVIPVIAGISAGIIIKMGLRSDIWKLLDALFIIAFSLGSAGWFQKSIARVTQELTKSNESISVWESLTDSALSMNFISLAFLGAASLYAAFIGSGIAAYPLNHPWIFVPFGIFMVILGVLGGLFLVFAIILKVKKYVSNY